MGSHTQRWISRKERQHQDRGSGTGSNSDEIGTGSPITQQPTLYNSIENPDSATAETVGPRRAGRGPPRTRRSRGASS